MDEGDVDARVRERIAAGDAAGAARLVIEELGPGALRFIRAVTRKEDVSADAFQEFAEEVWRGLPGLPGEVAVRVWAYRIAWRALLRVHNAGLADRPPPRSHEGGARPVLEARTGAPVIPLRPAGTIEDLLYRVTAGERAMLALRLDQGRSWAEVAEILAADGEAPSAEEIAKRWRRVKEKLAK